MRNLLTSIAVLLLSSVAAAQGATIKTPQPDYRVYGSYSRQMTVYRNVESMRKYDERIAYRRFREEIARTSETPIIRVRLEIGIRRERLRW